MSCTGLRETIQTKVAKSCNFSCGCVTSAITARLPILSWLPAYNFREHLLGDIIAGVTIAIMHIPQGKICMDMDTKNVSEVQEP